MLDAVNLANAFYLLAGNPGPGIDARVVSQADLEVDAFGGRRIHCDALIDDLDEVDAIVVAPIVTDLATVLAHTRPTVDWLVRKWRSGVTLTAVCTGTVLLAEAHILDDRVATTNPSLVAFFDERYPKVRLDPTLKLADEGRVVTAGATTSSFDLVIELIGRFLGADTAIRTAAELLTDPVPQSQKPYMLVRKRIGHGDREIQRVQAHIEQDYGDSLDPTSLAGEAAMSPRTLARRFRNATGESLHEYLRNTRVEAAMRRLAATEESIGEITERCGYADVRSFRRTFRELTGLSPREYRGRFSYARRAWAR
jgi:transcriptional regulator GlxA family with amidase domain